MSNGAAVIDAGRIGAHFQDPADNPETEAAIVRQGIYLHPNQYPLLRDHPSKNLYRPNSPSIITSPTTSTSPAIEASISLPPQLSTSMQEPPPSASPSPNTSPPIDAQAVAAPPSTPQDPSSAGAQPESSRRSANIVLTQHTLKNQHHLPQHHSRHRSQRHRHYPSPAKIAIILLRWRQRRRQPPEQEQQQPNNTNPQPETARLENNELVQRLRYRARKMGLCVRQRERGFLSWREESSQKEEVAESRGEASIGWRGDAGAKQGLI
ncbi:MAG: hypothetical protein Q9204_005598 [Flavoplaca sp. TL-2023a]